MTLPRSQAIALPPTPVAAVASVSQPASGFEQRSFFQDQTQARTQLHQNILPFATNLRLLLIDLYQSNVGLLLIAASQLFITLMNVAVKFLNDLDDPVPTLELVFVRMFITYFFSVSYMIARKIPHAVLGPPEVRPLLVFRGVSGFFGLFGIYYSLIYLSLSDAVVLTFLSPTTTAIAGFLFLREALSRKEAIAGLFSLIGVVLIARPQALFGTATAEGIPESISDAGEIVISTTSSQRLIAVGVAMLGVVGATGAYISLRAIGTRAHAMHSMTFFSAYSVIVSTAGMLIFRVTPVIPRQLSWCGLLAAVGICGFIAQLLLVMGLQRETASRGTLALYVQVIFATAFERLVFKVSPSYLSMLGTIIIMGCAIYVALNKGTKQDPYKRIPQDPEDLESHELMDTLEEPSIEVTNSTIVSKPLDETLWS
ncbi:hypothetical protein JB92DRAFT_2848873 [Gautieria morchelliformis]|nr:hypothetical protein JB92DRAFT_2848873 [Gautieria morchelliformis]